MKKKFEVDLPGESCLVCGDSLTLYTDAEQPARPVRKTKRHTTYSYCAEDGDEVQCKTCGFLAMASVDAESAEITWDETSEHNVKCAEAWEVKESKI
jgi:hypothetical protein